MNRYLYLCVSLLLVFLMGSCAPLPPPGEPTSSTVRPSKQPHPPRQTPPPDSPRTFTAAFASLPTFLIPYGQRSWHKTQFLALLYNGLTSLDADLQPRPSLASSWEVSPDGLVYTMHLRRGVQFHHGKELEAADVRFSFRQAVSHQAASLDDGTPFTIIATIHTPDRNTVRFVLKHPYAPFLSKLTVANCPIIPRDAPLTSALVPPGTGPFQLVSFQPGQSIALKKFPAYWEQGLPHLDTVILREIKDPDRRLQLLQSGEIDYTVLDPLSQGAPSVEPGNDVVLVNSAPTGTFSVILNTRRRPFAKADVRRAFAWTVDKAALAKRVLGPSSVPVNQPFNPDTSPWYVDVADRSPNLSKARELLTKAGYPEEIRVSLPIIEGVALFTRIALDLQEQLRRVGIRLQVEIIPAERLLHRMQRGEWDVLLRGEVSQADPDDVYFAAFHSSKIGTSNTSGYYSPSLDTLLSAGRHTLQPGKRRQLYRKVVSQIQEAVPELYLFMVRWPVAWRPRVRGYDRKLLRCCLMHTLTTIGPQGFKTIWLQE